LCFFLNRIVSFYLSLFLSLKLLQQERQLKNQYEIELADLRNRPPPVTPRQQPQLVDRSPSPPKSAITKQTNPPVTNRNIDPTVAIYLPETCPLTLNAVQANRNHLDKFKDYAVQLFERELDEMGIDIVIYLVLFIFLICYFSLKFKILFRTKSF
jgi:hypothetical protein